MILLPIMKIDIMIKVAGGSYPLKPRTNRDQYLSMCRTLVQTHCLMQFFISDNHYTTASLTYLKE